MKNGRRFLLPSLLLCFGFAPSGCGGSGSAPEPPIVELRFVVEKKVVRRGEPVPITVTLRNVGGKGTYRSPDTCKTPVSYTVYQGDKAVDGDYMFGEGACAHEVTDYDFGPDEVIIRRDSWKQMPTFSTEPLPPGVYRIVPSMRVTITGEDGKPAMLVNLETAIAPVEVTVLDEPFTPDAP